MAFCDKVGADQYQTGDAYRQRQFLRMPIHAICPLVMRLVVDFFMTSYGVA
jgi:hypothetical protein